MPDDAYLTAIRARDDSLVVDGLAEHAARVFDALRAVDGVAGREGRRARCAASCRTTARALDHFTIAARVARPNDDADDAAASNRVARPVPARRTSR